MDFLTTIEVRESLKSSVCGKKIAVNLSLYIKNNGKIKHLQTSKQSLRVCHQETLSKGNSKGCSLGKKKVIRVE